MSTPNTSATGGYLAPAAPPPADDDALEDLLHDVFAGITGLDAALVRPRFQLEPADLPAVGENWCAFGITEQGPEANATVVHNATGDGADTLQRETDLEVLVSFYGPQAQGYAGILADGFQIAQNRDALKAAGMNFTATGRIVRAPELVKERWLDRYDVPVSLVRQVNRIYPVLNLLLGQGVIQAEVRIDADPMVIPFTVRPK